MPPADAHTDADSGPVPQAGSGTEDTLDLRLSEEFLARFGEDNTPAAATPTPDPPSTGPPSGGRSLSLMESPARKELPPRNGSTSSEAGDVNPGTANGRGAGAVASGSLGRLDSSDLLDNPAEWRPVTTPAGVFQLVPVRLDRDLAVISRWMNDPAVAAFWELAGAEAVTAAHLRPQLDGDGRSVPCLGVLAGVPMSYWEIYRADLDPLARHYPARPQDTGIHLLIGGVNNRGHGVGTTLLRAVSDLVLDNRPLCARVVAEPDLRNTPSVSAFLSAGFRFSAEVELPDKRAALMVRDRAHRAQL
ncbi:GNAT family N-acetyltransferase [Streptomyces sp. NPDC058231]|uniref:GNAT family N-acetyltransferase n=1 Tax=Streptomyces sp. NPDC058231 TaxID=3346392 RepID=UPI0036F0D1CF